MINNICFITSSRADYGLLKNLMKKVSALQCFNLQTIVTGSHLSKEHGYTVDEIVKDNIQIDNKVPIIKKTETREDIGLTVGYAIQKLVPVISKLSPRIVILLGDRYEVFSAAIASAFLRIPIAHIHGGEITEGAIDDMVRHSITKLSNIHFVSNISYKRRVIQMGEQPKNVHNVGSLGVENLKRIKLLSLSKLQREIKFKFLKKNILITYHPVTLDKDPIEGINILLNVLQKFSNVGMIFTFSNADLLGTEITKKISYFCKNNENAEIFSNLGQLKFFSCLKHCNGMVGNSSSGIIEAPSLRTWSLNLGNRQKGRIKADSVFDVEINERKIFQKLNILLDKKKKGTNISYKNPYDNKNTSIKIIKILKSLKQEKLVNKRFFDID